ncbi:MAG: tyrosine-type recombinase/integrase [Candidatus Roizmanbacteria bacterium]
MSVFHVVKRSNTYYFRIRIPRDISSYIPRKEIWKSLNTSYLNHAKSAAKSISYRIEELFTWIRNGMLTNSQIQEIVKEHLDKTLKGSEYIRSIGVLTTLPKGSDIPSRAQWQQTAITTHQDLIANMNTQLFNNDFRMVKDFVFGMLERANIECEVGSPEYTKLCREFLKSEITIKNIEIERLNGNYNNKYDAFLETIISDKKISIAPGQGSDITVSKLIEDHVKEAQQANSWTEKSLAENESIYKVFLEIMGNRELKTITHQDLIACRDKLVKLPANRGKNPILRDKTIIEILAIKNITPMSLVTINKYLSRISSLFKWAAKHHYISVNVAEGLSLPNKKRASEDRESYSIEDIQAILGNLKQDPAKPERYWIPMIGLYSGMRLDEICQLHIEDIVELDKIKCININESGDKKLKTQSSERIVPIHPKLVELGLIKYVDSQRASGKTRLWENLKKGRDGYSHDFGKWYQRFNRQEITKNPKRVFHSLRHTLANNLKQKGVQEVVIAEILGHSVDSMTMSRYGKRYEPKVLLEALSLIDYHKKDKVDVTKAGNPETAGVSITLTSS